MEFRNPACQGLSVCRRKDFLFPAGKGLKLNAPRPTVFCGIPCVQGGLLIGRSAGSAKKYFPPFKFRLSLPSYTQVTGREEDNSPPPKPAKQYSSNHQRRANTRNGTEFSQPFSPRFWRQPPSCFAAAERRSPESPEQPKTRPDRTKPQTEPPARAIPLPANSRPNRVPETSRAVPAEIREDNRVETPAEIREVNRVEIPAVPAATPAVPAETPAATRPQPHRP